MRSQFRLRVLLPVAVLGTLGMGVGAFAFGGQPASVDPEVAAANVAARATAKPKPARNVSKPRPQVGPTAKRRLARALESHSVVVVFLYERSGRYDALGTREARAGALATSAGFVTVNVRNNRDLADLAATYQVRSAPSLLVFKRGPKLTAKVAGFADRETVAQLVQSALT